jgi:NAD(P)-dependent dehydrogenase (short-subunit alcohol dehydrogenase family)
MTTTTLTASNVLKEGNTAVITGASSGIGRASAWDFVSKGMNVWMVDNDKDELQAAVERARQMKKSDSQVRHILPSVYGTYYSDSLTGIFMSLTQLASVCLIGPNI